MVRNADVGSASDAEPVRLPPTQAPPKPRRVWPRWAKSAVFLSVLLVVGVVGSSVVNREVTHRLATVPPLGPTTTPPTLAPTTTTARPVVTPRVAGKRVTASTTTSTSTTTTMPEPPETPSELITALDALKVQEEHPDGFRGGAFGFWTDVDKDGCNTRDEVLIRDSLEPPSLSSTCRIQSGKWYSPYDDQTLAQPREVVVDHEVTIAEAWRSGAWQWTDAERSKYLNDLDNPEALLVVSKTIKEGKADLDPRKWLPPNQAYRCEYLSNWVHIKTIFKLSVDPGEREAIAQAALHC